MTMIFQLLILKLAVDLGCGVLNAWGGYSWHNARRFLMPLLIALTISFTSHIWWLGLCSLPAMGTLCIGYSKDGNAGRGLWLFIQAVTLSLGYLLLGHLSWYFFVPYIVIAGFLGGIYRNWQQILGDVVTGCWLGTFIIFVH